MSEELSTLPDSAQELPREIESYRRVQPGFPCVQSLIVGRRATAFEMAEALTVGDRLRTAGEPFEKDLNFVDGAARVVPTSSMQMTYQLKISELTP